jgi:hypothetical protein
LKDAILDIVRHVASLGFFDLAKITGTENETIIYTGDKDTTVVLDAKLKSPNAEMIGEFGLGNLSFLNGLCNLYNKEHSVVEINKVLKNNESVPDYIVFKDNDGNNDKYRLMDRMLIDEQLEQHRFKPPKWDVEFKPLKSKVSEMSQKAGIYSGLEPTFTVGVKDHNLIFTFGSDQAGSHFGRMTFASNISGASSDEDFAFPIDKFLSVLKLGMVGECTVRFSKAACMITIDSGIGVYNYILLGHTR